MTGTSSVGLRKRSVGTGQACVSVQADSFGFWLTTVLSLEDNLQETKTLQKRVPCTVRNAHRVSN